MGCSLRQLSACLSQVLSNLEPMDAAANSVSPYFFAEKGLFCSTSILRGAVRNFDSSPNTLTYLTPKQDNMAVARPIRVLGLIAIGLWVFFLYQVFGPEKIPKGLGDTLENMERDPNLDCMRQSVLISLGLG